MTVRAKSGKVVVRFKKHQVTLDPDEAAKVGADLIDAAAKAAKRGKAFSEP